MKFDKSECGMTISGVGILVLIGGTFSLGLARTALADLFHTQKSTQEYYGNGPSGGYAVAVPVPSSVPDPTPLVVTESAGHDYRCAGATTHLASGSYTLLQVAKFLPYVHKIKIYAWGAGGGGGHGGVGNKTRDGAAGAGGGFSEAVLNVEPSDECLYRKGKGGAGGRDGAGGQDGGDTFFGTADCTSNVGVCARGGKKGEDGGGGGDKQGGPPGAGFSGFTQMDMNVVVNLQGQRGGNNGHNPDGSDSWSGNNGDYAGGRGGSGGFGGVGGDPGCDRCGQPDATDGKYPGGGGGGGSNHGHGGNGADGRLVLEW